MPIYSFEKHARAEKTTTIYSPHVLILEGIFALHDQRVLDLLDLRVGQFLDPYMNRQIPKVRRFLQTRTRTCVCPDGVRRFE